LHSMKLYNYFRSSASFRVRIGLAIKGLPFDYVPVHLAQSEHLKPEYATKVSDALVPMLELDDGQRLTQSLAILEYLDEVHPEPPLLPVDPMDRARVRALALSVACEIHPLNNLRVLRYLTRELKVTEEQKNQWYAHWVRQGLEAFERTLQVGPNGLYSHGNQVGLADCLLIPQIFNAQRFEVPLNDLPRVMAVFDACMALESFQQARPEACPDADA